MASHAELVDRYQILRAKSRPIFNALAESLPKDAIGQVAGRLGILNGKEILLETEDELIVLVDIGVFDIRHNGENAVQRFVREKPPAAGTDEWLILDAMSRARHSIYQVQRAQPGVGVLFRDMLRDIQEFVWDVGFSHTARRGALMAARLVSPGEITITTGAALPVYPAVVKELLPKLAPYIDPATGLVDFSDPHKASEVAMMIIHDCVRAGASASIRYGESSQAARIEQGGTPQLTREKIGRNDPCPCGSAKKYKKCCGKAVSR
jgi:hypothetical protein